MTNGPIRRSQLIAPFGVGSLLVARDGIGLITAGLDHWYKRDKDDDNKNIDISEYNIDEWRLARQLNVQHFRLPPDYRNDYRSTSDKNKFITVPFLRFPTWYSCNICGLLEKMPLTFRERIYHCPRCKIGKKGGIMYQVPFVAMCENGHIQDFPWQEWVHRSFNPDCQDKMKLFRSGSEGLSGLVIECMCGSKRNLADITGADPDGTTYLSKNLEEKAVYFCRGHKPWLNLEEDTTCVKHLRATLRNASNVHFAQISSSIYIPRTTSLVPNELVSILENPEINTHITFLVSSGIVIEPKHLRPKYKTLLEEYSDAQLKDALKIVTTGISGQMDTGTVEGDDPSTAFRRTEFNIMKTQMNENDLKISQVSNKYEKWIQKYFARIMLVEKLRETRALTGFTRVTTETDQTLDDLKANLWRDKPGDWLPAYKVYGEGIFIEFNSTEIHDWEGKNSVANRASKLNKSYKSIQEKRRLKPRVISPRFVLLHTFAHLLINRLTFQCGYGSASIRERLYISDNKDNPMAGILIYTAAGDSEGTLGGLVRMAKPDIFEPLVRRALEGALWCAADPVCMELGEYGQGPNSLNLAACHNCALVPETTCEEFNRFLDRGLVIGSPEKKDIGYFHEAI